MRVPINPKRTPIITRKPIITNIRIPVLTYTADQKPLVDVMIDYYEWMARTARGVSFYAACGNVKNQRENHKNWIFFERLYLILKEKGWRYKEYLTVQFERASRWNHGNRVDIPLPNALYGEAAQIYYENWVWNHGKNNSIIEDKPVKFRAADEKPLWKQMTEEIEESCNKLADLIDYHMRTDTRYAYMTDSDRMLDSIIRYSHILSPWYCVTKTFMPVLINRNVPGRDEEGIPKTVKDHRNAVILLLENQSKTNISYAQEVVRKFEQKYGLGITPNTNDAEVYLTKRLDKYQQRILNKIPEPDEHGEWTDRDMEYDNTESVIDARKWEYEDRKWLAEQSRQSEGWSILNRWRAEKELKALEEGDIKQAERFYSEGYIDCDGYVLQPIPEFGDSSIDFRPYQYNKQLFKEYSMDVSGIMHKILVDSDDVVTDELSNEGIGIATETILSALTQLKGYIVAG